MNIFANCLSHYYSIMVITIDPSLSQLLPQLVLAGIQCKVSVHPSTPELRAEIDNQLHQLSQLHSPDSIRELEPVKATKDAYRVLGKDPNRYRPSAEALLRRVANGRGLYDISNVVDIVNVISATTGYSIGGYDAGNIIGDVTLGIGESEEPYIGIGRGNLNIERLPIFRDKLSAFGSPTSDSVRTMISARTTSFLMVFIAFADSSQLQESIDRSVELLKQHASGADFHRFIVTPQISK